MTGIEQYITFSSETVPVVGHKSNQRISVPCELKGSEEAASLIYDS